MKLVNAMFNVTEAGVAPHAGAWIETTLPCWLSTVAAVAPHAGAWIETKRKAKDMASAIVAPHAGAWIETFWELSHWACMMASHPTRVRGLKPISIWLPLTIIPRRTPRGCVD